MGRKKLDDSANDGKKTILKKPVKKSTIKKVIAEPPKKRGRKPKVLTDIDTSNENEEITTVEKSKSLKNTHEGPAIILKMRGIDVSKLTNKKDKKEISEVETGTNTEETDGMFTDDIPTNHVCHKCDKYEHELTSLRAIVEKYKQQNQDNNNIRIYTNKLNIVSAEDKKKVSLKKTTKKCWWDRNTFDTLPCFLPELYHNDTYHVVGNFCSYNCALAYNISLNDSKIYQRKSLLFKLYKEMYGLEPDYRINITAAGPWQLLEDFGGELFITEFRNKFTNNNKDYIVYTPPIRPINLIIEERNVGADHVVHRTRTKTMDTSPATINMSIKK